jgi:hypothetical protein
MLWEATQCKRWVPNRLSLMTPPCAASKLITFSGATHQIGLYNPVTGPIVTDPIFEPWPRPICVLNIIPQTGNLEDF